jgi:beta-glucosidase
VEVRVTLANLGPRRGREVVQLYVRQPVARISRPIKQLKAFAKVALEPGEARVVSLRVRAAHLGYTREDGTYVVEPGTFQALVGTSSDTIMTGTFEVER